MEKHLRIDSVEDYKEDGNQFDTTSQWFHSVDFIHMFY